MKRSYNIDNDHVGMRIDRWIRTNLGKLPQGLIEKSLRKGKIKINKRLCLRVFLITLTF